MAKVNDYSTKKRPTERDHLLKPISPRGILTKLHYFWKYSFNTEGQIFPMSYQFLIVLGNSCLHVTFVIKIGRAVDENVTYVIQFL